MILLGYLKSPTSIFRGAILVRYSKKLFTFDLASRVCKYKFNNNLDSIVISSCRYIACRGEVQQSNRLYYTFCQY